MPLRDGEDKQAALREIQGIRVKPQHESIVTYYGFFILYCWIVVGMELCDGSLENLFGGAEYRALPPMQQSNLRWEAIGQIAGALHACHIHNVVHRDIKPGNSSHLPRRANCSSIRIQSNGEDVPL